MIIGDGGKKVVVFWQVLLAKGECDLTDLAIGLT